MGNLSKKAPQIGTFRVTPEGLEPSTRRLRVACSAKLSYGAVGFSVEIIHQWVRVSTKFSSQAVFSFLERMVSQITIIIPKIKMPKLPPTKIHFIAVRNGANMAGSSAG